MSQPIRTAHTHACYDTPPTLVESGIKHWVSRANNFIVVVTHANAGSILLRENDPDEHVVLLPENVAAHISASGDALESTGDDLFIVPPGNSRIEMLSEGYLYRFFTSRSTDLANIAINHDGYSEPAPDVAPLEDWPMPVNGYRLRQYHLPDYIKPDDKMRLFRTRCLMINAFTTQTKPRDLRKMTPHAHADFEQAAITLAGQHVHHLRYPWTPDYTDWKEDQHLLFEAPSMTIIPNKVIHTSQAIGQAPTKLVEVFAPPRKDFSLLTGKVCNEDEYPLPESLKFAN